MNDAPAPRGPAPLEKSTALNRASFSAILAAIRASRDRRLHARNDCVIDSLLAAPRDAAQPARTFFL